MRKNENHCPCCKAVIIFPPLSNICGFIAHIHHKIVWFSISVYALICITIRYKTNVVVICPWL